MEKRDAKTMQDDSLLFLNIGPGVMMWFMSCTDNLLKLATLSKQVYKLTFDPGISLTLCVEQDKCPEGDSQDALVGGEGGAGTDEHRHTLTLHHLGMEAFYEGSGGGRGGREEGRRGRGEGGGRRIEGGSRWTEIGSWGIEEEEEAGERRESNS